MSSPPLQVSAATDVGVLHSSTIARWNDDVIADRSVCIIEYTICCILAIDSLIHGWSTTTMT